MKRDMHRDRPPPLKIHKQGHNHHHQQQLHNHHQQQQEAFTQANQYRQPVIIHTYSPEIIQTDSNNFRQLVQRLTGPAGHGSPPPPKRARVRLPRPTSGNNNLNHDSIHGISANSNLNQQIPPLPLPMVSPMGLLPNQNVATTYLEPISNYYHSNYDNLPHNPLLSPSAFDFSPSVLPSPSAFSFDSPSIMSSMALPSPLAPGSSFTPPSLTAVPLPSPGPLSTGFLADLPVLSPAAYSWIEKNYASADAIFSSRSLLTPRSPLTTSANLLPSISSSEDQKPLL